MSVTAELQTGSGTNWWTDWDEGFRVTVVNAHYSDPDADNQLRRRYRIDVFREATQGWDSAAQQSVWHYRIFKAGVYRRRVRILFNHVEVLTRVVNVTVQPELEIFVEDGSPGYASSIKLRPCKKCLSRKYSKSQQNFYAPELESWKLERGASIISGSFSNTFSNYLRRVLR